MPGSSGIFDQRLKAFIRDVPANTFLDLGCGSGKYAWFVRELKKNATIEGYEIEPSYIDQFNLRDWYTTIHNESCMNVMSRIDDSWDVVTIGDCLEHLRKSDGLDLIHFLAYRCKHLVIVYPSQFLQNSVDGVGSEAHISSWWPHDFNGFEFVHYEDPPMHLIGIQGFIPHTRTTL